MVGLAARLLRIQAVRYALVGALNVAFTLAVFWLLDRLFTATWGVQPVYWTAAVIGIAHGFLWQRLLVWRSKGGWRREFLRFLTVNLAVSITNSILLFLAVDVLGFDAFPAQVAITGALTVANYVITKVWIFKRVPTADDPAAPDVAPVGTESTKPS